MKLSTCLILKNEGSTIYQCLDSVKHVTDEFVIGIDNGCTDNTEFEVNRFINDNLEQDFIVYKYDWNDSFAEARNIGMDKANGDWIFILDGHEYVPIQWYNITQKARVNCRDALKIVVDRLGDDDTDEIFFSLYQQPFADESPNNFFMQPRIYRNGLSKLKTDKKDYTKAKIRFGRAAHNTIKFTRPEISIHYPEVILIHDAPEDNRKERQVQRLKMNTKQLNDDLKKNKKDTRALFYLGNTYLEGKEYRKAIGCYDKYLKYIGQEHSEVYQCYIHKALALKELKESKEQKDCLIKAVGMDPIRRDGHILLGDWYYHNEELDKAVHHYNTATMINAKPSRMFSNGGTYTWLPHQQLAKAYKKMGKKEAAIAHLRICLQFVKNKGWFDEIKELSGQKKNILILDSIGSFTKDFKVYLEKTGHNVVCSKQFDGVLATWADLIWCEWLDGNAEQIFQAKLASKTIMRIHGYEAYTGRYDRFDFSDFKAVIFVAKHIEDKMKAISPSLNGQCQVIQNGVDIDKFYINKDVKRLPNSVGYAGFMNVKKNPLRLASIIKKFPKMTFHLRIDWQDNILKEVFEYETKKCKNIVYHSRYDKLADFWQQMEYVISFSDIESFSFNVAEAMACGCIPQIYNWKGAGDIWSPESIFRGLPHWPHRTTEKDRIAQRDFIIDNYSLNKANEAMLRVLQD
jgi:glycosyltransferase involved in cell wall biosynthesis